MAEPVFEALPPAEAVDFFRAKGLHVGFSWLDTDASEHLRSFTVAKAARLDILEDIRGAVDEAIAEGTTFEAFHDRLEETLRAKGWWGRRKMVDPATGEIREVQLGSPRRLRIIFDTNIRMAYAKGRWDRIERLAQRRPYLRYVGVLDERIRPAHAAWHGTVLRWDHPFWQTHYPPNGWNCRCTVQQLSERDLERFGYKVSDHPPEGWDRTRPWENRRTGTTVEVPRGIDPGFGHNVGRIDTGQAAADRLIRRIDAAPPDIARAAIGRPWDGRPFRRFIEQAQRQSAEDRATRDAPGDWPVAVADADVIGAMDGHSRAVRLGSATAWKQARHHPEIGPRTYALVQRILDEGEMFRDGRERHVVGFLEIDGQIWRAVFKVTRDRRETFLLTLHRVQGRDIAKARRSLGSLNRNGG